MFLFRILLYIGWMVDDDIMDVRPKWLSLYINMDWI